MSVKPRLQLCVPYQLVSMLHKRHEHRNPALCKAAAMSAAAFTDTKVLHRLHTPANGNMAFKNLKTK